MLLVTGASGLLGASIVYEAIKVGRNVVGFSHRQLLRIPGAQMFAVDLTAHDALRALVAELRPQNIIHCAAATNVDWCEDHILEAEQINVQASAFLADAAHKLDAGFVYVSTDAVFDGTRGNYAETDETSPLNTYARSKLRGEQEVLRRCPSALIVRVNIYGWNAKNKQSLAEWILYQLMVNKTVPGFTDVYFTPLLTNDLAEILLTMLEGGLNGIYHVVGSERLSKYEFARRVAATFGIDPGGVAPTRVAEAKLRAPRAPDLSLSTEKISEALGHPMPDVESGLRRFRALRESGYQQQLKSYLLGANKF
jgi:dTDP-4-dehydrorhamnose reductase